MRLHEELDAQSEAVRRQPIHLLRDPVAQIQPQVLAFAAGELEPKVIHLDDPQPPAHLTQTHVHRKKETVLSSLPPTVPTSPRLQHNHSLLPLPGEQMPPANKASQKMKAGRHLTWSDRTPCSKQSHPHLDHPRQGFVSSQSPSIPSSQGLRLPHRTLHVWGGAGGAANNIALRDSDGVGTGRGAPLRPPTHTRSGHHPGRWGGGRAGTGDRRSLRIQHGGQARGRGSSPG